MHVVHTHITDRNVLFKNFLEKKPLLLPIVRIFDTQKVLFSNLHVSCL